MLHLVFYLLFERAKFNAVYLSDRIKTQKQYRLIWIIRKRPQMDHKITDNSVH